MHIVGRIVVMILAYGFACIAASMVLAIGALAPAWDNLAPGQTPPPALWSLAVLLGAAIIGSLALLPALLMIILAESFAWRSAVIYGVLGCGLSLVLYYGIDFLGYARPSDAAFPHEREVLAASGIAGGLVYWLLAGRMAGWAKP